MLSLFFVPIIFWGTMFWPRASSTRFGRVGRVGRVWGCQTAVSKGHKRLLEALQQSLRRCEVLEGLEGLEGFGVPNSSFGSHKRLLEAPLRGVGRVGRVWG